MRFEFGDGGSKVLEGVKVHGRLLGASAPTVMFYNAQMGAAQATGGVTMGGTKIGTTASIDRRSTDRESTEPEPLGAAAQISMAKAFVLLARFGNFPQSRRTHQGGCSVSTSPKAAAAACKGRTNCRAEGGRRP